MAERSPSILRALVGSELSTVVFVRDYVQLGFEERQIGEAEPGILRVPTAGVSGAFSAFTLPRLQIDGRQLQPSQPGYCDALVELIGRQVIDADENDERLWFVFDGGVIATVSLDETHLVGRSVESAELQLYDEAKSWMVWRPGDRQG